MRIIVIVSEGDKGIKHKICSTKEVVELSEKGTKKGRKKGVWGLLGWRGVSKVTLSGETLPQ